MFDFFTVGVKNETEFNNSAGTRLSYAPDAYYFFTKAASSLDALFFAVTIASGRCRGKNFFFHQGNCDRLLPFELLSAEQISRAVAEDTQVETLGCMYRCRLWPVGPVVGCKNGIGRPM
jgi:hypothetical protein